MNTFSELFENSKSKTDKNTFYLAKGMNYIRIVALPKAIATCFTEYDVVDKDSGEKKTNKRSEIVYDGCGYEKGGKTEFFTYCIDANDQVNEDGSPKIKVMFIGWKVLEGIVAQEKSYEAQGEGKFTFPMKKDLIITKSGEGIYNTTYSVAVMLSEENNKVKVPLDEIRLKLETTPSLEEWKIAQIEEAKERHAKYGVPRVAESKKVKKNEDLETIQIAVKDEEVESLPEEDINLEDIPF